MSPPATDTIEIVRARWTPVVSILAAGWLLGCSSATEPTEEPNPPAPSPLTCQAGELLITDEAGEASCLAAGVPSCAEGFVADEAGGCLAVLPDAACPSGTMALPGETSCRPVMPCGDGTWGDIPVDANTRHVDPSFGGLGDGSASAPYTTITAAVASAPPGAVIALAAGDYPEQVRIEKPVTLWGRCPQMVTLAGDGSIGPTASVLILAGGTDAVVRGVGITGSAFGIAVSGATNVTLDRVWVHDVASRGIDVENTLGPAEAVVVDSLVERATGLSFFALGAGLTLDRSEVRDTLVGGGATGRGISARSGSTLTVRDSYLHHHHDQAILLSGSTGSIERTLVTDTAGSPGVVSGGVAVQRDSTTLEASAMSLTDVIVERSANYGVLVEGSTAALDRVVVRDTQLTEDAVNFGAGLQVQGHEGLAEPSGVTVNASVFERNRYGAISVTGGTASVWSTILRDTAPRHGSVEFGRGTLTFYDPATGLPASMELVGSVVSRNHEAGVFVQGGTMLIDRSAIVDTQPSPEGIYGRGINVQSELEAGLSSEVTVVASVIADNHELGVYAEGSTLALVGSLIRGTKPRPGDGHFGDGAHVDSSKLSLHGVLSIEATAIVDNARVGVGTLGATVRLLESEVSCNPIALNGYSTNAGQFAIEDLGGNDCSCQSNEPCKVSTQEIEPPPPLDGPL